MTDPVTVVVRVPWPRYADTTGTGRISMASRAGRVVPWLSLNAVTAMHRRVHQVSRQLWRDNATQAAIVSGKPPLTGPVRVVVQLHRHQGRVQDVTAVVEGLKPVLDGFVLAGLLQGDSPAHVVGVDALRFIPCAVGTDHALIALVPV